MIKDKKRMAKLSDLKHKYNHNFKQSFLIDRQDMHFLLCFALYFHYYDRNMNILKYFSKESLEKFTICLLCVVFIRYEKLPVKVGMNKMKCISILK